MVAAAAPTDVAQDWGVGNPGGLGNGKGNGTWEVLRSLAGVGKRARENFAPGQGALLRIIS